MTYSCCDELRRAALADPSQNPSGLNGIDFLEVLDHDAPSESDAAAFVGSAFRQRSHRRAADGNQRAHRRRRTHHGCHRDKRDTRSGGECAHR